MSESSKCSTTAAGASHHINSLKVGETVDPVLKVVVGEYKLICICCGLSLEEIHPAKRTRKPRAAAPASVDASLND
jgi:hypothetical protein